MSLTPESTSNQPQTLLEAGASQLSLSSSNQGEDWDRSMIESSNAETSQQDERPSTPPSQILSGRAEPEGTPSSVSKGRTLSDLLRRHTEKGRVLNLSNEDEERLTEELGNWINSDSSPYEHDDSTEGDSPKRSTHPRCNEDSNSKPGSPSPAAS